MPDPSAKLSPQTRLLISEQREGVESAEPVDLLIRVSDEAAARERLEACGASVRTVAGDVVTASAPVSALQPIAELDDVVAIEVSTPLYGESPPTE
ncbi:MAG TPA: hypothetical protein VGW10_00705 [Solirubrobacteraceae bacterium]|nr:hypothetical protein [Solirubrobacteraceae bacterium]